jgi:hypothetical protein
MVNKDTNGQSIEFDDLPSKRNLHLVRGFSIATFDCRSFNQWFWGWYSIEFFSAFFKGKQAENNIMLRCGGFSALPEHSELGVDWSAGG